MSALLLGLLGKALPFIIAAGGIAGGILFGWFKKKSADTAVAKAGQQVAQAGAQVAQSETQIAQERDADAQANAAAALAGNKAVKESTNAQSNIEAMPAGDAAQQLRDQWTQPGSSGAVRAAADPKN
jgi:hypothetical protein